MKKYKIKLKNKQPKAEKAASVWQDEDNNHYDVLGSWTGNPADENDKKPVQDSDDL